MLGALLAAGVALGQIVGLYVLLLIRWAVGAGDAPDIGGLVVSLQPTEALCSQRFRLCPRFLV
jgi:hypothetical protein